MMETIYFKGKYAPTGQDWFHCEIIAQGRDGVKAKGIGLDGDYFFPWSNIERIKP